MALTSYSVDESGIALLRLERDEARNAMNTEMLEGSSVTWRAPVTTTPCASW